MNLPSSWNPGLVYICLSVSCSPDGTHPSIISVRLLCTKHNDKRSRQFSTVVVQFGQHCMSRGALDCRVHAFQPMTSRAKSSMEYHVSDSSWPLASMVTTHVLYQRLNAESGTNCLVWNNLQNPLVFSSYCFLVHRQIFPLLIFSKKYVGMPTLCILMCRPSSNNLSSSPSSSTVSEP